MRNKLGLCLMLGLAVNTLLFSGLAQAVSFSRFNVKLNGIGVSADNSRANNQRLFVSLGKGFAAAKPFNPVLKYENAGNYVFECGGVKLKSGATCHLKPVKYGDSSQVIRLYNKGKLADTYTLIFTNLPVIEINTSTDIINTPKVPGSIRLMSGEFKQDTGKRSMGIELRGQTSQAFSKKSYGFQFESGKKNPKIRLLNMPAGDDWILDASYADTSFARNLVSFDIFNQIHPNKDKNRPRGQNAIKGHLAEAIVNGKYAGVYVLDQHVGPTLLGLKPAKGTVIYKADFAQWKQNLFFPYKKGDIEVNFSQTYPKTKADFTPLKKLIDFVAKADEFNFTDNIAGQIDLAGLADWYLLTKATQASDNTSKNFFLAKNAKGKFFVVPWDHNAILGMSWDGKPEPVSTFFATVDNNLINRLLQYPDTNFALILKKRWAVLRKSVFTEAKLLARFDQYHAQLVHGGAITRNSNRWPQPGTIGTDKGISNPKLSTRKYMSNFLKVRLPAMDAYIRGL